MSITKKYQASLTVLLMLILIHANAIDPMPLCDVCATDDGTSCLTCQTPEQYATIVNGNYKFKRRDCRMYNRILHKSG